MTGMFFRYAVTSRLFTFRIFRQKIVVSLSQCVIVLIVLSGMVLFDTGGGRAQESGGASRIHLNKTLPYTIHQSGDGSESVRPELGYFDELVIALFEDAGLPYIVAQQAPWKRVIEQAAQGDRHVIYPTTRTADREDSFKWVGPVSRTIWNLYGYADAKWQNMAFSDILTSARIGVLLGSAREAYLRQRGAQQLVLIPRENLLLPMLQAERVDLIAIGGSVLRHYRDIVDPSAQQRDIDGVLPYRSCFLYIAISKAALIEDIVNLQNSLDKNKESGQFIALREKHSLSTNTDSAFLRAMLNLDNNGIACIDLFGRED